MTEQDLLDLVPMQARAASRRFRQYVDLQDVVQEGYLYVLQKPEEISWLLEQDEVDLEKVCQLVRRRCERYCRKEKAAKVGYRPGDEFFYADSSESVEFLADLLPHALADNWPEKPPMDHHNGGKVSGKRPPHEGGNWPAMLADVSAAYARLDANDRRLLGLRFRHGLKLREIGVALAWSTQTASERIHQSLRRLLAELGGSSPWR